MAKTKQAQPAVETNGRMGLPTSIEEVVSIKEPNMKIIELKLVGITPLMILRFSQKAKTQIMETQMAGSQAKSKKERKPKDFEQLAKDALYVGRDEDGTEWNGINASAFRNAAISVCRLVGFKMTIAKLSIFVIADGRDIYDSTPLIKIVTKQAPETTVMQVRNASGVIDLRSRPRWDNWSCKVKVRFDADQFSSTDVVNLFARIGAQNGIGELRPGSREGNGGDYGLFRVDLD